MEDAVTCEICSERFSSSEHDPLALTCGHTYCRLCLSTLIKNSEIRCPTCRKVQGDVDITKLPIIYKLLSVPIDKSKSEYDLCGSHGDELTYWCQECQVSLCGLCLFKSHPQDHAVIKIKTSLEEKRSRLKSDIKSWERDLITKHKASLQKAVTELKKLYRSQAQLSRSKKIIGELIPEIDGALNVTTILDLETKINSLKLVSEAVNMELDSPGDNISNQQNEMEINNANADGITLVREYCGFIRNSNGQEAKVEWHGGKLLLSAFSNKISYCDLLFKMPTQMFLQLSIRGEYIGQVVIQPFFHLRRAHQFAALCLGMYGVSYVGSVFRCMENKDRPREYISGGYYIRHTDGNLTNRDLMTALEWDGEATGESRQGAVLGVKYGAEESGFGICTRDHEGGTFKCHFGQVISGMDTVKAAARHHPVTEVIINNCGAIIPDFVS